MTSIADAWLPTALTGILALLALEAVVLVVRRPMPMERLCSVVAGGCLLAAWRASLAGAPFALCAAVLALAGTCHALPWFLRRPRHDAPPSPSRRIPP